jgi:2-polyprenyl-3-methyl-5-hydroxy-6-metoxy-1,4-benzoquinol methylase
MSLKKMLFYNNYDSNTYWKSRAKSEGQLSVLWLNEHYNRLVRNSEMEIINPYLKDLKNAKILDIGCGTGYLSNTLVNKNPLIQIDAVDFEEMILEASKRNSHERITFISSSAEDYFKEDNYYDLIISSGCFSAIRDINSMKNAITNSCRMIKPGGKILMIDPFHASNLLARAKIGARSIIKFVRSRGMNLELYSGILFWPYRLFLSQSEENDQIVEKKFNRGEKLLDVLGNRFWSDYKVLVFKK